MKRILPLAVLLLISPLSPRADIIAQWNCNSVVSDGNVNTGTTNASVGTGLAAGIGGVNTSFITGDTTHDPAGSTDNSAWQTTHYPAVGANNKTGGVRFDASTAGYTNIVLSWYQRNTSTASRYARCQYTLDGSTYVDTNVISIFVGSVFTNQVVDLSGVPGAANNPLFGFRIVSEFENSATGSGTNAYVATTTGSGYGTGGNIGYDMVSISGTLLPGANTPPAISDIGDQTIRVGQSTAAVPFIIGDAEDAASSLTMARATSDATVIPVANIALGGSGSNRTVTVTATSQTGQATIFLYVIDTGGRSNSTSFTVTVLPLNTAPVISSFTPTNTLMGVSAGPIPFSVYDLETPAGALSVSGSSANRGLVPPGGIAFGGGGSNRTVTITPAAGQSGVAVISVSVSDGTNSSVSVLPVMVTPSTNVIFYDPFTYADGSVLTNSGLLWGNRSGNVGECQLTNGQLEVNSGLTEDIFGQLIGGLYAKSNGIVLYAGFRAKFLTLPKSVPGYFAHFTSGNTFRGRIFAGTTNAPSGSFRLQVSNGSDTPTELQTNLGLNTNYVIVTRYALDTSSTTLWLNPSSESDPGVTASDSQSAVSVSSYDFREDSSVGGIILVDDLRVGLSFASVLPGGAQATPIPLAYGRFGTNIVLSWSDSAFLLQSAPAPFGAFTNIPGATSPFTNGIAGPPRYFRLKN